MFGINYRNAMMYIKLFGTRFSAWIYHLPISRQFHIKAFPPLVTQTGTAEQGSSYALYIRGHGVAKSTLAKFESDQKTCNFLRIRITIAERLLKISLLVDSWPYFWKISLNLDSKKQICKCKVIK